MQDFTGPETEGSSVSIPLLRFTINILPGSAPFVVSGVVLPGTFFRTLFPIDSVAYDKQAMQCHSTPKLRRSTTAETSQVRISHHDKSGPSGLRSVRGQVNPLVKNWYEHTLLGITWETQFEKVFFENGWREALVWELLCAPEEWDHFHPCSWMRIHVEVIDETR